jgi:hypothetical protein
VKLPRRQELAGTVSGASQQIGTINSDEDYQAAISLDWVSVPDPLLTYAQRN